MASKGRDKKNGKKKNTGPGGKLHCDEAAGHVKVGNYTKALQGYNLALELNPNDKNALVARSKCYLLLGEPQLSLQDAETALKVDKSFIRGIFQKAEALYHLGDFEHSLMYYHRGHRLRPELEGFRLGIQKAQEAIENTIGGKTLAGLDPGNLSIIEEVKGSPSAAPTPVASSEVKRAGSGKSRPATAAIRRQARHLLGELCVDKDYLEQLLKHPDIKCLHQESVGHIASHAEEGIAFLTNRQEFWRQQKPAATTKKKERRQQRSSQLVM
ncbi:outer dynein arm-docking complex subunit 4 isoform X1 [Anabrus simplex]|uniref:outer dynein arm-docking complex subunit 4 isoform X1 n=1 Tax=Anabrus simplex TaxID=316456 RepID=UPI0034DCF443